MGRWFGPSPGVDGMGRGAPPGTRSDVRENPAPGCGGWQACRTVAVSGMGLGLAGRQPPAAGSGAVPDGVGMTDLYGGCHRPRTFSWEGETGSVRTPMRTTESMAWSMREAWSMRPSGVHRTVDTGRTMETSPSVTKCVSVSQSVAPWGRVRAGRGGGGAEHQQGSHENSCRPDQTEASRRRRFR